MRELQCNELNDCVGTKFGSKFATKLSPNEKGKLSLKNKLHRVKVDKSKNWVQSKRRVLQPLVMWNPQPEPLKHWGQTWVLEPWGLQIGRTQ